MAFPRMRRDTRTDRRPRCGVAGLFVLGVCAAVAGAPATQQPAASEQTPGLTVDFVALQADGAPARDLRPSDVDIRIGNRARTVRDLRFISTAAPAPDVRRGPAPYGTNDDVASGRSFVLAVDQESFGVGEEPRLRNAAESFVHLLSPMDRTMVLALPFGGVKAPFTSDTIRLRSAMAGIIGQRSRTETGSDMACRTRRFFESLQAFLESQRGRETPVTVVVFSGGLAAPRRDAPMMMAPGMCELLVDEFQRVGAGAAAARANVFLLHPVIDSNAAIRRENIAGVGDLGSNNPLEGIEHLAGATGAVRLPLDSSGAESIDRIARESSGYYEVDITPERGEAYDRSQALSVRVSRPGIVVHARPLVTLIEPRRAAPSTRLAVPDLLTVSAAYPALRLRTSGFTVRDADNQLRVGVVIEPLEAGVTLDSAGAVLVGGDRIAARWFARDLAVRPLVGAMSAPEGTYRLRVVAMDTSGRIGAAEDTVTVGLTPVGPLSLGSLMLGVAGADGIKPQLEFSAEPTARASFDIYGGVSGLPLTAVLEIAREAGAAPVATVPLALARAGDARVVATGVIPLGALAPGDYVVRGVITLQDGPTGNVVRTLRKTKSPAPIGSAMARWPDDEMTR